MYILQYSPNFLIFMNTKWKYYSSFVINLISYTGVNWAGCSDTQRTTCGCCIYFGDYLIYCSAKRQHTLSRSSVETEYQGLANTMLD